MMRKRAIMAASAVALAAALLPTGYALAQDSAIAPMGVAGDASSFTVTVRDLDLPATAVVANEGYAGIRNETSEGEQQRALADRDGNLLFEYVSTINDFYVSEGIVTWRADPRWYDADASHSGHFNLDGTPLYDATYDFVYPFSEGVAAAMNIGSGDDDHGLYLIDTNGNRLLTLGGPFGYVYDLGLGDGGMVAKLYAGSRTGAEMKNGLIPFSIDRNAVGNLKAGANLLDLEFDADLAEWQDICYGYMDINGNVVIPPDYYDLTYLSSSGLGAAQSCAAYVKSDSYFLIDSAGNRVIGDELGSFVSVSVSSTSKLIGVSKLVEVDENSAEPRWGYTGEGTGFVQRYGYIDSAGDTVVPFEYEGGFDAGEYDLCTVGKRDASGAMKYGLVTPDNEVVVPCEWDDLSSVTEGVAYGVKGGELYALDIAPVVPDEQWSRLAGDDRLGTMQAITKTGYSSADTVLVTTGWGDADALTAAGLSGILGAPILTTAPSELSSQASSEITRLGAKEAIILGGTNAVSPKVESQLRAMGLKVSRLTGGNRIETALKIYAKGGDSWGDTCILSKGWVSADALAAGSYAYANRAPIFLAMPDGSIDVDTANAVKSFDHVIVLGGTQGASAVRDSTVKSLGVSSWMRLAGDTRYDTAVQLATWASGGDPKAAFQPAARLTWQDAAVAFAWNYPDALVGVNATGPKGSVTLLASTDADDFTKTVSKAVGGHATMVSHGYVLGGKAVVSDAVVKLFESAAK